VAANLIIATSSPAIEPVFGGTTASGRRAAVAVVMASLIAADCDRLRAESGQGQSGICRSPCSRQQLRRYDQSINFLTIQS
jgi:hypothetical protein